MQPDTLLSSVHSGREVLYNFFYRTFINSPNEDLYTMAEELFPKIALMEDDGINAGLKKLGAFIHERGMYEGEGLAEYDLDTLRGYTRILCLTDSVPTVESYYTSVEKLAMQDARDEVLKYYIDYKMKKSNKHNEQEDFVAVEMHFMSYMAKLTAEAIECGDNQRAEELTIAQRNFLVKHPMRWFDQFLIGISAYKESERLYTPITEVMSAFIKYDKEFLDEILS